MKRYIAFILALLCVVFAGCAPSEETIALEDPETGITLSVKDVTPTGCTIVCTQKGGMEEGELSTGSYFVVEKPNGDGWIPLAYTFDGETAWTMEAYLIPMNDTVEWTVDWSHLYGELEPGSYRIGKDITVFYEPGDSDVRVVYAEFTVE